MALDGKALRRALNKKEHLKYVVSAWAESNNLVLGQLKVDEKSNEITAVPQLLRVLELAGCIVTIDAMGCQKKIAKEIIEVGADYVLALKGNQETVHGGVRSFLGTTLKEKKAKRPKGAQIPKEVATLQELETVEKDHGRFEIRRYYQSDSLDWFADQAGCRAWEWSNQFVSSMIKRRWNDAYYLSSLKLNVQTFALAVRRALGRGEQGPLGDGCVF